MARPPRNDIATHEFHKAVTKLLRSKPATPEDVRLWAHKYLDVLVSAETIRRTFIGECDPNTCSVELLIALHKFFEVPPAALGSHAEERVNRIAALIQSGGGGPDKGIRKTGWLSGTPETLAETPETLAKAS